MLRTRATKFTQNWILNLSVNNAFGKINYYNLSVEFSSTQSVKFSYFDIFNVPKYVDTIPKIDM